MKFYYKYDYSDSKKARDFSDVVEIAISNSGDSDSGMIETLESRIRTITTILNIVAHNLPDQAKIELANHFGYTPVE